MKLLADILLLLGATFFCLSAIGLLRLPDSLSRMHAASKGSSLGLCCVLAGAVFFFGSLDVLLRAIIVTGSAFLTVPIATHLLARASVAASAREEMDSKSRDPQK